MPHVTSVLLIDDDPISNFLTATVLKNSQAFSHIRVSSNGREALDWLGPEQQATGHYPDLILLDLNMPNMNGFTFLKFFRQLPGPASKSRIMVLSTSNYQEDIEYLKQFPEVEVFLQKPLTEESLQYILNRYFPVP
jgi:CheY-like chemotaxis protein